MQDGKITSNCQLRLIRDLSSSIKGKIASLRRFKDDAKSLPALNAASPSTAIVMSKRETSWNREPARRLLNWNIHRSPLQFHKGERFCFWGLGPDQELQLD